ATRTAVSGSSVGPGLFEMLEVIGQASVVRRLRNAVHLIPHPAAESSNGRSAGERPEGDT
ncbi:MAG: hypothetical protein RDU20_03845, partial [Desulfomonilaceae bacterium]|nr:hypothetical protein [Desulfomonilaceae bacterium]